jgi:hypothetical protein
MREALIPFQDKNMLPLHRLRLLFHQKYRTGQTADDVILLAPEKSVLQMPFLMSKHDNKVYILFFDNI